MIQQEAIAMLRVVFDGVRTPILPRAPKFDILHWESPRQACDRENPAVPG
jgi:hypothetical protein